MGGVNHICLRDESDEVGVTCALLELHSLMTRCVVLDIQAEEQRGKKTVLRGISADGSGLENVLSQPHTLSDTTFVIHLQVMLRHVQLRELANDDRIEGRAEGLSGGPC